MLYSQLRVAAPQPSCSLGWKLSLVLTASVLPTNILLTHPCTSGLDRNLSFYLNSPIKPVFQLSRGNSSWFKSFFMRFERQVFSLLHSDDQSVACQMQNCVSFIDPQSRCWELIWPQQWIKRHLHVFTAAGDSQWTEHLQARSPINVLSCCPVLALEMGSSHCLWTWIKPSIIPQCSFISS